MFICPPHPVKIYEQIMSLQLQKQNLDVSSERYEKSGIGLLNEDHLLL